MNRKHEAGKAASPRKNFSENRMYYEKTADKYHIIQYVPLLFLIVFAVLTVLFGWRSMLGDNFRYLYKALTLNPVSLDAKYEDISYAAGSGVNFALYKDDLAVIGEGKVLVYDLAGDMRFRRSAKNTGAAYAVSEKYLAVYTPGSKGLSVYNSFGSVYEENLKNPIRIVAVSDSGRIAACLKGEEASEIMVLDKDFSEEASFSVGNGVAYDLDFSPNGDRLLITSLATVGGAHYTEISVWDVSSEKLVLTEKIDGKKPISAGFFDDGRFYAAVQGNIFFYQANGKSAGFVSVAASEYAAVCDGERLAVLRDSQTISLYSKRGDAIADIPLSEKVFSLKCRDGLYYTVSNTRIAVCDEDGGLLSSYAVDSGLLDFFVLADGSILLCYVTGTERVIPSRGV